jgi:hypothetical protein
MNGDVIKIRKLLGLGSIDKGIFSIFFPKSKLIEDGTFFLREGSREQTRVSNLIFDIVGDCEFIKKKITHLSSKNQTEEVKKEIDLNSFVFERKIEELVFLINNNFDLFSDYFAEQTRKEVVERVFIENELPEGISLIEELKIKLA